MSYLVEQSLDGQVVEIRVTVALTRDVYEEFTGRTRSALKSHGRARLLLMTLGFQGWNAGLQWEDVQLDLNPLALVDRLAIVGESKWEDGKTGFCHPFRSADIQYFDHSKVELAREWIYEGL